MRQQVIATLGRFEELQASGQLERLLRSGARFAAKGYGAKRGRQRPNPAPAVVAAARGLSLFGVGKT